MAAGHVSENALLVEKAPRRLLKGGDFFFQTSGITQLITCNRRSFFFFLFVQN